MAEEKDPKKAAEELKALNDERERANQLEADAKRIKETSLQLAKDELLELKAERDALKEATSTRENSKKLREKETEVLKQELKVERELIKEQQRKGILNEAEATARLKAIKQKERELKLDDETLKKNKELNNSLVASISNFLGLSEAISRVTPEGMINTTAELNQISTQIAQTGISMDQMYGSFLNLNDITDRTNKSFGVFVGQVASAEGGAEALTQYGAGFKEINESVMGLRMSMAGFSDASAGMQSFLAGNAAKMKNLGVSVEEQGKNWNFLTKSLGMTGLKAAETTDKLAKVAISAGIPVKNLIRDFGQIGPQLAAQGPKAIEIFSNLAKEAKSLGVEVSSLMSTFGSAMDTFEGAATAAGKFNAVMGGDYLNTMELLNATEDQRVEIVKRQMDATGQNFATMSKYQKIAVANALGIKDVNEAQMILAGSTDEMRAKKEKEAATQEQLNKLQADAVTIGAKLASVFQVVFGAMLPLLEIIQKVANAVLKLNDYFGGKLGIIVVGLMMAKMLMSVIPLMGKAALGLLGIGKSASGSVGPIAAFGEAWAKTESKMGKFGLIAQVILSLLPLFIMLGESIRDTWAIPHSPIVLDIVTFLIPKGLDATGDAMTRNVKPILAFGAAMLMVGGGVYLAATGLGNFVKSFSELNTEQLIVAGVALLGFGLAMAGIVGVMAALAFSGVGEVGVALMLAFGVAILMVGAGVWLAAQGMTTFVNSLYGLNLEQGAQVAASLYLISGGIMALMASLVVFAYGGILGGGLGLIMLSGAILAIGASLERFPTEKSISFSTSMNSLKDALQEIKTTTEADIQPTLRLVQAVKEYTVVKEKTSEDDPLVKLLREIKGVLEKTGGAAGGKSSIEIKLDKGLLAKEIKENAPNPMSQKGAAMLSYGGT